jgi:heme ABC exporter ATP-binding subunit CcmA
MIEFDRVTRHYGATVAVDGVAFAVQRGELLALVGPNGAGKTTLIRMLVGLVRPTSGSIRVDRHDAQRDGVAARRLLGYLPQRSMLYGNLSVVENLAFLARLRGVSPSHVADVLALVRLDDMRDRPARALSGGMLQRLGLAQALLARPPILVLDEPTASLDPQSAADFKELLRRMHAAGTTVLLSSHILGDVQALAQRVAIIDRGRLVALDSVTGLVQRCALPERLWVDLVAATGTETEMAVRAGAASAIARGLELEITVLGERKLAVLQALTGAGTAIRTFRCEAPTLEQVFLQLINQAP